MKKIFLLLLSIFFGFQLEAQEENLREHIIEVASYDKGVVIPFDISAATLGIDTQIRNAFKLDASPLAITSSPIVKAITGKGWYLYYEFEHHGIKGLYKELLQEKNKRLLITETRSAEMAMATNCDEIAFTDDDDDEHCKCISKKNIFYGSELTHRLFFSIQ